MSDRTVLRWLTIWASVILVGLLFAYFAKWTILFYMFAGCGALWGFTLLIVSATLLLEKYGNH